jgi:hypothetical protein
VAEAEGEAERKGAARGCGAAGCGGRAGRHFPSPSGRRRCGRLSWPAGARLPRSFFAGLLRALGPGAAAPRARTGEGATFLPAAPNRSQGAPPGGRKRRLRTGSDTPPVLGVSNAEGTAATGGVWMSFL